MREKFTLVKIMKFDAIYLNGVIILKMSSKISKITHSSSVKYCPPISGGTISKVDSKFHKLSTVPQELTTIPKVGSKISKITDSIFVIII